MSCSSLAHRATQSACPWHVLRYLGFSFCPCAVPWQAHVCATGPSIKSTAELVSHCNRGSKTAICPWGSDPSGLRFGRGRDPEIPQQWIGLIKSKSNAESSQTACSSSWPKTRPSLFEMNPKQAQRNPNSRQCSQLAGPRIQAKAGAEWDPFDTM